MYVRREHSSLLHRCVSHGFKRFKTAGSDLKKVATVKQKTNTQKLPKVYSFH
jgi:hypothetical protein